MKQPVRDPRLESFLKQRSAAEAAAGRQGSAGAGGPPTAGPRVVQIPLSLAALNTAKALWKLPDLSGELARCRAVVEEKRARGEAPTVVDEADVAVFGALLAAQAVIGPAFERVVAWRDEQQRAADEAERQGLPRAGADDVLPEPPSESEGRAPLRLLDEGKAP